MRRMWDCYEDLPPAAQLAVVAVAAAPLLVHLAWPNPVTLALLAVPLVAFLARWARLRSACRK